MSFARVVVAAVSKAAAWTAGGIGSFAPSPQTWATRLGEHVGQPLRALMLHLHHGFSLKPCCRCWLYPSTWTEQALATASSWLPSLRPLNHHSFRILSRYSSELVEQVAALIVAAVSQIESINAQGLRQLHVDLDYVANCCRLADSKLM